MTMNPPAGGVVWGVTLHPADWTLGGEYVLMAMAALRDAGIDVGLRVLQSGSERERLLFTAHDLGIADRIELPEADGVVLSPEREARWAFIGMRCSRREVSAGLSRLTSAVPVVAPDGLVLDRADILYYEPRSPASIAAAVGAAIRVDG